MKYGSEESTKLDYMDVEISYGSQWVSLNDHEKFIIDAENTRDQSAKTWRKFTADSPVLGGSYLVHAVPDMVNEQVSVYVHGEDQTDLNDNMWFLQGLFEQFDFRMRWTFNEYREYWRCQLAEASMSRGQVWTHNTMGKQAFTVPRFPDVTRERLA